MRGGARIFHQLLRRRRTVRCGVRSADRRIALRPRRLRKVAAIRQQVRGRVLDQPIRARHGGVAATGEGDSGVEGGTLYEIKDKRRAPDGHTATTNTRHPHSPQRRSG